MFLKDGQDRLVTLDMTTEEVSWTQNVAALGRDLNGALYATWVRFEDEADPANAARLYCDANDGTGNKRAYLTSELRRIIIILGGKFSVLKVDFQLRSLIYRFSTSEADFQLRSSILMVFCLGA